MDTRGGGGEIDEAMEALPVAAAHLAQDELRGGKGKREQDYPGEEADLDEATLFEVLENAGPDDLPLTPELGGTAVGEAGPGGGQIVAGKEEDVGGEVERGVEEGVQAEQAAEADEVREAWMEAAKRGHGKRDEQDPESPVPGEVGNVVDGVGEKGEGAGAIADDQENEGGEAEEVNNGFDVGDEARGHGWSNLRSS